MSTNRNRPTRDILPAANLFAADTSPSFRAGAEHARQASAGRRAPLDLTGELNRDTNLGPIPSGGLRMVSFYLDDVGA